MKTKNRKQNDGRRQREVLYHPDFWEDADIEEETSIRSSAAQYLPWVAAPGEHAESIGMRYEDGNIRLTEDVLAVHTVNDHIRKIYAAVNWRRMQQFGNSE